MDRRNAGKNDAQVAIKRMDNRQTSVTFYGAPFFKTVAGFAAKYNEDYLRRWRRGEFFPINVAVVPIRWTHFNDKLNLIRGVRQQVLDRLRLQIAETQRSESQTSKDPADDDDEDDLDNKPLVELMQLIDDNRSTPFRIDWFTIAQQHLDGRHKPNECEAIWMATLRPQLRRDPWTEAEEDRLMDAAARFNYQDWDAIAAEMDRRSSYQCLVQYRTRHGGQNQKLTGRFSADEDALLVRLVQKYRIGASISWSTVAAGMPGRGVAQCYNRYTFSLQPDISRARFTVEEDCILLAAHKQHGFDIAKYMHLLPGRSRVQIRNRYNNVLRFDKRPKQWTEELDRRLMELVEEHGEKWALIATQLDSGHARQSVRSRYVRIRQHLSRPNASLADLPRRCVQHHVRPVVTKENWMEKLLQLKTEERTTTERFLRDEEASQAPSSTTDARPKQTLAEYLRYSYRLRLEPLCEAPESAITPHTETVCRVLRTIVCPLDYRLLHATTRDTIDIQCLPEQVIGAGQLLLLPPSWCTALLWRGLALMFPLAEEPINDSKHTGQHPIVERIEALQVFRQRFRSLLLNTAAMTNIWHPLPEPQPVPQSSQVATKRQRLPSMCEYVEEETIVEEQPIETSFIMNTEQGIFRVEVIKRPKKEVVHDLP